MVELNPSSMAPHTTLSPKNILTKNTASIVFILLSSLPLLCFMVMYESFLRKNLIELVKNSTPQPNLNFLGITVVTLTPLPIMLMDNLAGQLAKNFILLSLVHFPLSLLNLVSMILTVDLASKIYKDDEPSTLTNLCCPYISLGRLKGQLTTFMYTFFLSTCGLLGIICFIFSLLYVRLDDDLVQLVPKLVCPIALACLLLKYLELSVVWNMSSVVSVLEDDYGANAFALSFYYCQGKKKGGVYLMFGYVLARVVMRVCYFYVDDGWFGVVVCTGALWITDLVKWVGFVVYYHYCKSRTSNKKNEDVLCNDV